MKTSTNMADSFKPSLLDQLREKSEALRAGEKAARKPMEEALKDIDRILWRAFRWLDEAMGHLEVIRPRVGHVFHLHNILTIERPLFDRGFVSFRRRALAGMEVLEHVELFYRMEGDKPIALRLNPAASLGVEERLRGSTLPYSTRPSRTTSAWCATGCSRCSRTSPRRCASSPTTITRSSASRCATSIASNRCRSTSRRTS